MTKTFLWEAHRLAPGSKFWELLDELPSQADAIDLCERDYERRGGEIREGSIPLYLATHNPWNVETDRGTYRITRVKESDQNQADSYQLPFELDALPLAPDYGPADQS
jgi:hypothetical protein